MAMIFQDSKRRFESVYAQLAQGVFRYVYFRVRDYDTASDITQSVFMKFYKTIDRVRAGDESPYIMTMAKNQVIDYYRTRKLTVSFEESLPAHNPLGYGESPAEDSVRHDDVLFVQRLLEELPSDERDIVLFRAIFDMSYKELSEQFHMREDALRKKYSRALEHIRSIIQSKYSYYGHTS